MFSSRCTQGVTSGSWRHTTCGSQAPAAAVIPYGLVRQDNARSAHSARSTQWLFVPLVPAEPLTCDSFHVFLFHMFRDDAPRGVRGDPRKGREGLLTCTFACAQNVQCGRYGRYLDADMTLIWRSF